jgi:FkbM family methyltransferase
MNYLKILVRKVFGFLPFSLQVFLARGNPDAAFYIRKTGKVIEIDYFLEEFRFEIDTNIDLQRRILSGSYESETMRALPLLVKENSVCLDIGANVGAISFALAQLSGKKGIVHAFEPGPNFYSRFKKNLQLNPQLNGRIILHEVGLSDHMDSLPWQASEVYTGTASMDPALHEAHLKTHYLPVLPLDDFAPIKTIQKIDFIKIDVDGLELPIFRGAIETLKKYQPNLYFETTLWNEEQRVSTQEIEKLLRSLGYELYQMPEGSRELIPATFPNLGFNTIAKPKSS